MTCSVGLLYNPHDLYPSLSNKHTELLQTHKDVNMKICSSNITFLTCCWKLKWNEVVFKKVWEKVNSALVRLTDCSRTSPSLSSSSVPVCHVTSWRENSCWGLLAQSQFIWAHWAVLCFLWLRETPQKHQFTSSDTIWPVYETLRYLEETFGIL